MKVLSIREPYASLIKNGIKTIETRSWKTNYRGKIYIHSCKTKDKVKDQVKHLVPENLMYGYILCTADLVDCVYMDEEYIDNEKRRNYNNFLCGRYEVGRYGWVLNNIEVLENRIPIGGQLGLWNYSEGEDES
jgi:ASC-1-like (ASCH) protein